MAQRYVTGSTEATNALFFQVELNGIARVGADPLNASNVESRITEGLIS